MKPTIRNLSRPALPVLLLASLLWGAPARADSWTEVDRMFQDRQLHTATLLPSGRVLVVGGSGEGGLRARAEIFDPTTGTWTATGALHNPRQDHTATLLPTGEVLVVGGDGKALASAEIFDPATGTWTETKSLGEAWEKHTATLLPSGDVLVVGGYSAKLYHDGAWLEADSIPVARWNHTATLLASGEVLVVGGSDNSVDGEPLNDVRIYDPGNPADPWSKAAASLNEARAEHTATLLPNGLVLVVGGDDPQGELYDPSDDEWTFTGPIPDIDYHRVLHTATLLPSGQVLVAGGFGQRRAQLYDPAVDGDWIETAELTVMRDTHTATLLPSGQVLAVGGSFVAPAIPITAALSPSDRVLAVSGFAGVVLSSVEIYTPGLRRETLPPTSWLTNPRAGHTATRLPSGEILVAGGSGDAGKLSSVELYAPDGTLREDDGKPLLGLHRARSGHSAALLASGEVLITGGKGIDDMANCDAELYALDADLKPTRSCLESPLAKARSHHRATLLPSGGVLVAGGVIESSTTASVELLIGDTWSSSSAVSPELCVAGATPHPGIPCPLSEGRSHHTATLLPSGKILVTGGGGLPGAELSGVELYDPATGIWAASRDTDLNLCDPAAAPHPALPCPLVEARSGHTATLLPSGKVLVTGGKGPSGTFGYLTSAELYDPAAGTWTAAGSLAVGRSRHTATLLPSGRVLVTGGEAIHFRIKSAEVYDPATGIWTAATDLAEPRSEHTATLSSSGEVLVVGGVNHYGQLASAELYDPDPADEERRPEVVWNEKLIRYGQSFDIVGSGFGGDSEASGGGTRNSAAHVPFVQLRALDGNEQGWLSLDLPLPVFCPDPLVAFCDDQPATLTVREIPPIFKPGLHMLTVFSGGVPSRPQLVDLECSVFVARPQDRTVAIGAKATFGPVDAAGARSFQWQSCVGDTTRCGEDGPDWTDIPGATTPSYTTSMINGPEAGTRYRVLVDSGCTSAVSQAAVLVVEDAVKPGEGNGPPVAVVSPDGGELWTLSTADEPSVETITWTMSDNVRVCQVDLKLLFSADGGQSYQDSALDSLNFNLGDNCAHPGLETTSATYEMPTTLPEGEEGVLYKVELTVTDHTGVNETVDVSDMPFFIVRPNNDSVRTLILWHKDRMANLFPDPDMDTGESDTPVLVGALADALANFAAHPAVRGRVVDLGMFPDLAPLYQEWDDDPADANTVLFGPKGVHEKLRDLLDVFTGVEYLVLVGDDRVIPLARLADHTRTAPEEVYPDADDLTPDGTTVGRALEANHYLSDDPLASFTGLTPSELEEAPDLAVGRLVETPAEIVASIATFISQEGILDLTTREKKVLVSAYDFLVDSGTKIGNRWDAHLEGGVERDTLIGQTWEAADLGDLLCPANGANEAYGVINLNGHATHYQAGNPSDLGAFEIEGLEIPAGCALTGSVVYAVGCHSGLPVAGSTKPDADHEQDLPQTMLDAGATVYLANTGYGWGLKHGVGYSERLVEIFTEELTAGDSVVVGDAVKRTKELYSLTAPRFDAYDEKVSKQWTLYGFPMYTLKTREGDAARASSPPELFEGPPPRLEDLPPLEHLGPVTVERRALGRTVVGGVFVSPPPFVTRLDLAFDFSADGVYKKFDADGVELDLAAPCGTPQGCYYALNNISSGRDLNTGTTDRPLQPMFVFDSRLSGTSFHGFLWKGGTYVEEDGWIPLIAELQSNIEGEPFDGGSLGGGKSNGRGKIHKNGRGRLDDRCPASDLDVSSLVLEAGEVARSAGSSGGTTGGLPDIQRRFETVDVEILYFNDTDTPGANCDDLGPEVLAVRHRAVGTTVDWEVEVIDPAGVWRVVVTWNDGRVDAAGRGRWQSAELEHDGVSGTWRGLVEAPGAARLTYFVQAVDSRGNVTVPVSTEDVVPPSGVPLDLPELITVDLARGDADLAVAVAASPNPVRGLETLASTIEVTNLGPDPAAGVTVRVGLRNLVDAIVGGGGWSCETASEEAGVEVTCTRSVAELGPAPPITIFATATAGGDDQPARLVVTASSLSHDAVAANDAAIVTVAVLPAPLADLFVEQTVSFADDGSPIFVVTAGNRGPEWVDGARIVDFFHAVLTDVAWTCAAGSGSTCPHSGVGHVDDLVRIAPGSQVRYVVSTTLAAGFGGLLTNTAAVTPPDGVHDPDPASNSSMVTIDFGSIFTDGFESGDVTTWSSVVGETP